MKHKLLAILLLAGSVPAAFAADVGVSVSVDQPGLYGRIDIGDFRTAPPRVIYAEPVIVEKVTVVRDPVYMHVPPGHAKHWDKHCHEYNACGQRVLFVQDDWYSDVYVPHEKEKHGNGGGNSQGEGHGKLGKHGKGHGKG